ncbi:hypothetical protein SMICM17S_05171 [Streptomyces microflavus]
MVPAGRRDRSRRLRVALRRTPPDWTGPGRLRARAGRGGRRRGGARGGRGGACRGRRWVAGASRGERPAAPRRTCCPARGAPHRSGRDPLSPPDPAGSRRGFQEPPSGPREGAAPVGVPPGRVRLHGWREHDTYGPARRRSEQGPGGQPDRTAAVRRGRGAGPGAVPRRFRLGAVVYRPYTVPTSSMAPTIDAGDRVLAQRIDGADVRRGDVVVFKDETWAQRPDGQAGRRRRRRHRLLLPERQAEVNGKEIDEPYLPEGTPAEINDFPTVTVPEGRLFLLGDERPAPSTPPPTSPTPPRHRVARCRRGPRGRRGLADGRHAGAAPTGFETLGRPLLAGAAADHRRAGDRRGRARPRRGGVRSRRQAGRRPRPATEPTGGR